MKLSVGAPSKATGTDKPIVDTPAGDLKTYSLTTWMMASSGGEGYTRNGLKTQIVFGADRNVYVQNVATAYMYDTWIKGTLSEDSTKITFANHQPYYEDADGNVYYFSVAYIEDDAVYADTDTKEFTMKYDKKTGVVESDSTLYTCIVNADGGVFTLNNYYCYEPFNDKLVELPAGLSTQPYVLKYTTNYKYDYPMMVYVANSGDDFYFKGFSTECPDAWVKGTLTGDSIIIENNQYIGLYKELYFLYVKGATFKGLDDENYGIFSTKDHIALKYNKDDKSMYSPDGILICLGNRRNSSYSSSITTQDMKVFNQVPAKPSTPDPRAWDDNSEPYNMGYNFAYVIPVEDVDGNYINVDSLYYYVYQNGEIFVFHNDFFHKMQDGMTLIPALYQDGERSAYEGSYHSLWFEKPCDTIGLQSVYIVNGVTTVSDICTMDTKTGEKTTTSGIATAVTDANKKVSAVRYYDLSGRLLQHPVNGIFIQSTVYSDGSVENTKMTK
jgi:hypothetical protein